MFTANEVAEKLNVSKVTIYSKLKKHEDMVVMKQGKKYVTEDLFNLIKLELSSKSIEINELTAADLEEAPNQVKSRDESELIKQNNILIDTLLKQLEIKDKQITELQDIIKVNNKLMENNQVLLKNAQQQDPLILQEHFDELDKKIHEVSEKMESRKYKKQNSFFAIFKKKEIK